MAENTPTPWSLHDRWIMSPAGPVALASGYQDWATAPGGARFDEWKANAAFIVKAVNNHDMLVSAIKAIKQATIDGKVCDDVAWFDTITTLHDFCDQTLAIVTGDALIAPRHT